MFPDWLNSLLASVLLLTQAPKSRSQTLVYLSMFELVAVIVLNVPTRDRFEYIDWSYTKKKYSSSANVFFLNESLYIIYSLGIVLRVTAKNVIYHSVQVFYSRLMIFNLNWCVEGIQQSRTLDYSQQFLLFENQL